MALPERIEAAQAPVQAPLAEGSSQPSKSKVNYTKVALVALAVLVVAPGIGYAIAFYAVKASVYKSVISAVASGAFAAIAALAIAYCLSRRSTPKQERTDKEGQQQQPVNDNPPANEANEGAGAPPQSPQVQAAASPSAAPTSPAAADTSVISLTVSPSPKPADEQIKSTSQVDNALGGAPQEPAAAAAAQATPAKEPTTPAQPATLANAAAKTPASEKPATQAAADTTTTPAQPQVAATTKPEATPEQVQAALRKEVAEKKKAYNEQEKVYKEARKTYDRAPKGGDATEKDKEIKAAKEALLKASREAGIEEDRLKGLYWDANDKLKAVQKEQKPRWQVNLPKFGKDAPAGQKAVKATGATVSALAQGEADIERDRQAQRDKQAQAKKDAEQATGT